MSIASLLAVATIAYTSSGLESGSDLYVSTPHGLRLKKCVHAIPENARVHEHADGLMVHLLESGSAYLISHDKECEAEAEGMARQRRETNQWQSIDVLRKLSVDQAFQSVTPPASVHDSATSIKSS